MKSEVLTKDGSGSWYFSHISTRNVELWGPTNTNRADETNLKGCLTHPIYLLKHPTPMPAHGEETSDPCNCRRATTPAGGWCQCRAEQDMSDVFPCQNSLRPHARIWLLRSLYPPRQGVRLPADASSQCPAAAEPHRPARGQAGPDRRVPDSEPRCGDQEFNSSAG